MLTVNGTELQKHQVRGPVGYTVVGSPTIVDGVASGFSASNYIRIDNFTPYDYSSWEIVLAGTNLTNYLIGSNINNGLTITRSALYLSSDGISWDISTGPTGVQAPLDCFLRLRFTGSQYIYDFSTDKTNWTVNKIVNSSSKLTNSINKLIIGKWQNGYFSAGSIDLNETYIKVNGKLWFYQPADTKYIVKDGKLVWADPRLALSGPVGYEVVGSPSIVDGIASGFSANDYLTLPTIFSGKKELDVELAFKLESDMTAFVPLLQTQGYGMILCITPERKIGAYLSFDGTSWGVTSSNFVGSTTIALNSSYSAMLKKTATTYELWLKNSGGSWNLEASLSNSDTLVSGSIRIGYGTRPFPGSIDLNNTYIKVNDQLWFYGKNYATQNIAPVPAGYTYGNTTTPSIGYVDMRTQQFTAAPSGATIGRDE